MSIVRCRLLLLVLLAQCSCEPISTSGQWERARQMWMLRDINAHRAWAQLDPESPEGAEAHRRLERAEAFYKKGIELFKKSQPAAARLAFVEGATLAPIAPAHYFTLGELYLERGLNESAARYYYRYTQALPDGPHAEAARAEFEKLKRQLDQTKTLFEPDPGGDSDTGAGSSVFGLSPLAVGVASGALATLALVFLLWLGRGLGVSLGRLVDENPELHSAVAYLVGSLRHELLKHRIGAVSDVLAAMQSGQTSAEQEAFLRGRLYGGVPVEDAWSAHVAAFEPALGHRLNLRRDRAFREAARAVSAVSTLRGEVARGDRKAASRLSSALEQLKLFDRHLASLQKRLVRTGIDDALMRQVISEVRGEYAISGIELDHLGFETVEHEVQIEVPRSDLILILKNLLRNAILSVSRSPSASGKLVGMYVRVDLEPTGQEVVRISVCDSSAESFDTRAIEARGMDSGLGLVMAAIRRYGGSMEVAPGEDGYTKEVVVRFFRAFEDRSRQGEAT